MKTCFKCNVQKDESEFYKHPQTSDGLLGKCKDCAKKDIKEYRIISDNPRKYDIARSKRPERKKSMAEYLKKRRKLHPERNSAYLKVYRAIKNGTMKKESCFCGNEKSQAHHDDYLKPLQVIWLCQKHHDERHKLLGWG